MKSKYTLMKLTQQLHWNGFGNSMETFDFDASDKLKETGFPYTDEVHCLCGQTNGELFKCLVCMTTLCEICPSRPMFMDGRTNCVECILLESNMEWSTGRTA